MRFQREGRSGGVWCFVLLAWLGLAFAAPPLSAQDQVAQPNKEKLAQYRELIAKALQEYSLGHWPEAHVFFMDAHALWPNARTLRGLGMASYEARSYVEAIGYLEQAIGNKTQPLTPKLAAEAQSILEQAKRFVSSVHLEVEPQSAGVTIDDEPVTYRPDGALLLDPGEHTLQVVSSGYTPDSRTIHAEAGRDVHLRVVLRSLEQPKLSATQAATAATPVELQGSSAASAAPIPSADVAERLMLTGQNATVAGALSAVGVAGAVTGWVFYALRDSVRVDLWTRAVLASNGSGTSFSQSSYADFQRRGGIALAATGVGMLSLSAAQYFWLPDDGSTPVWAWVAGGVGSAVALGALGWAALGKHCEVTDKLAYCQSTASDTYFAPMLALQAVPFLTLPLFYAIRQRVPMQDSMLTVGYREGGLQLTVAGVF